MSRSRSLAKASSNAGTAITIDLFRAVRERDAGARLDTGTNWSGATITLTDGSTLPNANRVREWLGVRLGEPGSPSRVAPSKPGSAASTLDGGH